LLDGFEQGLEVTSTETVVITSLNYLNENSWAIFEWFSEYLKEITLLVEVDQNVQFTNNVKVLLYLGSHIAESLAEVVIITSWDGQELASTIFHTRD